jgi:hypothetical protein
MKTPYDAALRLRQREIDAMRVAIGAEVGAMAALEQQRDNIDASVRAEREIAGQYLGFSSDAYAARMRTERAAICRDHAASDNLLIELRAEAVEHFGSFGAITAAADRYRDEARRVASAAEQGQIDDFSAARFARVASAARRRSIAQAAAS